MKHIKEKGYEPDIEGVKLIYKQKPIYQGLYGPLY